MKKLLRILPYITMVWVAMYVNKETGMLVPAMKSKSKAEPLQMWATKKQCMKAAKRKMSSNADRYAIAPRRAESVSKYKPVCYRLTKYSTR